MLTSFFKTGILGDILEKRIFRVCLKTEYSFSVIHLFSWTRSIVARGTVFKCSSPEMRYKLPPRVT